MVVQVGAGQTRPHGLPFDTTLLVATAVRQSPHMALHALGGEREDTEHLVVHQRGDSAWLREQVTALWSWASPVTGPEIEAGSERPRFPANVAALCCRTQALNGDIL